MRQQGVTVEQVRVGMKRHRRNLVRALERRPVERLDIGQHLVDLDALHLDGSRRQPIKHEGVI